MSGKVYISLIRNPFKPEIRERWEANHIEGQPIGYYIKDIPFLRDVKLIGAINGIVVDNIDRVYPTSGDHVIVTAEIEGAIAGAIASFVVEALVPIVETASFTGLWGAGMYGAALLYGATYLVTVAAIGWGVSTLVDALSSDPGTPDMGSVGGDANSSPTYGWGKLHQVETEGNPIPIIFGEHKVAGQVINKFITVKDNNKEYYNAMLAINDGLLDSISDIRINDQSVDNYRNISTFTRLGTLNDSIIPGFDKIVEHRSPGVRLTTLGYTMQTDGDSVDELTLVFSASRGLRTSNDQGGLDEVSVYIEIHYRAVGDASWIDYGTVRISGASTSAVRKSVTISGLTPDQYEVDVKRTSGESGSWKTVDVVYFAGFKEVISDSLIYPGIAKYAIKALATDQLSGQEPSLSCLAKRDTVSVYNPNTSSWENENAENPAWATYALLNEYHGIHRSRIVYSEFKDWADYCDETVEGEPRFRIGIVLDNVSNVWKNVQRIASLARARVVRRNTKYGVFVDKPETTVSHLFTMGNIISETFNMQYLPMKDRANAVEVTYVDPDRDYSNQVVGVYSDKYINTDNVSKKTSVKFNAAIRRSQAIREAAFRLNSNEYLIRTIEFEAAIDSFDCVLGDLVYFQHLVPYYNEAFGGRIVDAGNDDGNGNPYVQLDQEVELAAGTSYAVLVRLSSDDSLVEKSLQAIGSTHTTDTLLLSSSWSTVPSQYDLYAFGKASTYKKTYRVTNITRSQELTRRITCMEYVEEIYSDTGYVIENPTWGDAVVQEATQVKAEEFLTYSKAGDYQSNIHVSWNAATEDVGSNWDVWLIDESLSSYFEDGTFEDDTFQDTENHPGIWHVSRTADMNFDIGPNHLVQNHTYTIIISPAMEAPTDTGDNTTRIQVLGKLAPPNDVTGFTGTWNAMKRTVNFAWNAVSNLDISHYEIRQGATWDGGTTVVKEAKNESASVAIDEGVSETRTYLIKAVDTSDIYSTNYDSEDVAIDTSECPLSTPTGLSLTTESGIASDGTDRVTIRATWDANAEVNDNFHHYRLLVEEISSGHKSTYETLETQYQWEVIPNKEYGAAVQALDVSGNSTSYCTQETITAAKDSSAPTTPSWQATALVAGFKVIGLRWQKNTEYDLSHYEVQRSDTGAFAGEEIDLGDKDGNFTTDTDLSVDTTYYYRIRAVDTSGNASSWSIVKSATTLQVGSADIAYDSITANHISATEVSAAFASLGTMEAGIIQSTNWATDAGVQIDLDNEMVKLGGSSAPKLSWDGITLTVKGDIVAGLIQSVNWGTLQGMQIDLDNEIIRIGGSSDPDFDWSGGVLSVKGSTIGGTMKTDSVRIESGDGNTYFDGNTMTVQDANGVTRVKLGAL